MPNEPRINSNTNKDVLKSKSSVQDRLRQLKNARAKSILDNKRAVYDEIAGIKTKRQLVRSEEEDDLAIEEKPRELVSSAKKMKTEPTVSVLEYTAEEDEKWEAKQGRINAHEALKNTDKGELHNYKQLAEQTYSKNIHNIERQGKKKSSKDYQQEKEDYEKMKAKGLSEEEIRTRLTSVKNLDRYVKDLSSWEGEVFRKRRKVTDEGKDGAIHEKNRQFNSKLERHYRQFEK